MAFQPPTHGVILHIEEIQADPRGKSGETVRVLGKLLSYDPHHSLAQIEHASKTLTIDTTLLGDFPYRVKSLLQFIGVLEDWRPPVQHKLQTTPTKHAGNGHVILQAKIMRNVDGLDLTLYDKALQIRRQFEEERARVEF
ncbi:hypothetical protein HK097_000244 [Rhizophlyctis rosea]|uniref:CST complex subunit TEN1 n=1 Tax=Rhizophlyctis rosea TaxID=64517 RepID=A0AAD5S7L9_9FUNG|nr:hypothetical protein HK097_000244 [Rhizophlyctis rosea]